MAPKVVTSIVIILFSALPSLSFSPAVSNPKTDWADPERYALHSHKTCDCKKHDNGECFSEDRCDGSKAGIVSNKKSLGRRQVLNVGGAAVGATLLPIQINDGNWVTSAAEPSTGSESTFDSSSFVSPNTLLIQQSLTTKDQISSFSMPLIAYSFYKTSSEQSPRALSLALRSGIRHFDLATDYNNLGAIAPVFRRYWKKGNIDWNFDEEKVDLVDKLDSFRKKSDGVYRTLKEEGSSTRKGRQKQRRKIFLTYKLSNEEQSTEPTSIRNTIKSILSQLDTSYLDLVCIHSPLTDSSRRIATYKSLFQLKDEGYINSIGVCNYGLCHLQEIEKNNLPLPSFNQLELSPFNTHKDVVQYCQTNNIAVSCAAWSRLSSVDGPVEQWAKLGDVAKEKGVTKAQILVRWALQRGFGCAPRSGTGSKLERVAIGENSYGGVLNFELSREEMVFLDNLNVDYKAGKLGRRDGWKDADVTGPEWEPTEVAC